jgi:hypothetical protein
VKNQGQTVYTTGLYSQFLIQVFPFLVDDSIIPADRYTCNEETRGHQISNRPITEACDYGFQIPNGQ